MRSGRPLKKFNWIQISVAGPVLALFFSSNIAIIEHYASINQTAKNM